MKLTLSFVFSLLACAAADNKLPPPYQTPSSTNRANVIPKPEGARLSVPEGFTVEQFASGFQKPRIMLEAPGGQILVTDSVADGSVIVLNGKDRKPLIEKLDRPYGMTFWKDYLYVAEATALKRYKFDPKAVTVGPGEMVIPMPDWGKGHITRTVAFDPKGQKLYIGIGSESNADPGGPERRASILRCNPDGSACEIYASGLRNATSIYFYPGTSTLWATVQERDGLGDDLVPDFFTHIQPGGFYGWPYAYFGPNEDPKNKGLRPELVKKTIEPDVSLGAHTAVIDWTFYTGKQFPAKYHGGAFLALRGSSNRAKRVGYSVIFIPFKNGKPAGPAEDFFTGFMLGEDKREVWGRPTGVTMLKDGSLLVSEDGGNTIWRISYAK